MMENNYIFKVYMKKKGEERFRHYGGMFLNKEDAVFYANSISDIGEVKIKRVKI